MDVTCFCSVSCETFGLRPMFEFYVTSLDAVYIHFRPMAMFVSFLLLLHARENINFVNCSIKNLFFDERARKASAEYTFLGISFMRLVALFLIGVVQIVAMTFLKNFSVQTMTPSHYVTFERPQINP